MLINYSQPLVDQAERRTEGGVAVLQIHQSAGGERKKEKKKDEQRKKEKENRRDKTQERKKKRRELMFSFSAR